MALAGGFGSVAWQVGVGAVWFCRHEVHPPGQASPFGAGRHRDGRGCP